MNQVVRQSEDEADYKEFLEYMRTRNMDMDDCNWMLSKCQDIMETHVATEFGDMMHIYPTWKIAKKIIYDYLQNDLTEPIAILIATMGARTMVTAFFTQKVSSFPLLLHYVWA